MKSKDFLSRHYRGIVLLAVGVALYFYLTRDKIVGTVDASGAGMTVNGQ